MEWWRFGAGEGAAGGRRGMLSRKIRSVVFARDAASSGRGELHRAIDVNYCE